jgi:hypothetical protein
MPSPVGDNRTSEPPVPNVRRGTNGTIPSPIPSVRRRNDRSPTTDSTEAASQIMYFASQPTHFSIPFEEPTNQFPNSPNSRKLRRHGTVIKEEDLFPARMPPRYTLFDFFPFSLFVGGLAERGRCEGRKAARLRAKMMTHNFPLELSLYLVRLPELFCPSESYNSRGYLFRVHTSRRYRGEKSAMTLHSVCTKLIRHTHRSLICTM